MVPKQVDLFTTEHWKNFHKVRHAQKQSWQAVLLPLGHKAIANEWLDTYIQGDYAQYGNYWYFERERDSLIFTLKWK